MLRKENLRIIIFSMKIKRPLDFWRESKSKNLNRRDCETDYTLGAKMKGSPVFFIKNVSISNGQNFDPERRTEI